MYRVTDAKDHSATDASAEVDREVVRQTLAAMSLAELDCFERDLSLIEDTGLATIRIATVLTAVGHVGRNRLLMQ